MKLTGSPSTTSILEEAVFHNFLQGHPFNQIWFLTLFLCLIFSKVQGSQNEVSFTSSEILHEKEICFACTMEFCGFYSKSKVSQKILFSYSVSQEYRKITRTFKIVVDILKCDPSENPFGSPNYTLNLTISYQVHCYYPV